MKKSKIGRLVSSSLLARVAIVLLFSTFVCQGLSAQTFAEKRRQRIARLKKTGPEREMMLNSVAKDIKKAKFVVLGRMVDIVSFYTDEPYVDSPTGKRIYTATKIQIIHDYRENMKSQDGYFLIAQPGGVVGDELQEGVSMDDGSLHGTYGYCFGNFEMVSLYLMDELNVKPSPQKDTLPIYGFSSKNYSYSSPFFEDDTEYLNRLGFQTSNEFDKFVYKTLGKKGIKKKDVGLRDFSIEPTSMKVNSISYPIGSGSKIHAGTREILTIVGKDFGDTEGNVLFRSADYPYKDNNPNGFPYYFKGLDSEYIVNWSDTKIEVLVPSYIFENYVSGKGKTAGSGRFKVQKPKSGGGWKTVISPSWVQVNIEYSILNSTVDGKMIDGVPNFTRYIHAQRFCMNGMVFTLHKSIDDLPEPNRTDCILSIEKALLDWTNELSTSTKKFSLELEKDINGNLIFLDISPTHFSLNHKRNLIAFGNTSGAMVTTFGRRILATSLGNKRSVVGDGTNIIIKPDTKWWYKTTGNLPANKRDFYAAFLHELGHVIGVGHDIDLSAGLKNLMSWVHGTYDVVIPAVDRISITNHSARGKNGAHANIDFSRTISFDDPTFKFFKQLNKSESAIHATPVIGTNYKGVVSWKPLWYGSKPPFDFWIDNYSEISSSLSRDCTTNFEFLWKWSEGEKYADCLAEPEGLQWRCNNQIYGISARILDASYEDTGVCSGASLESLPMNISYWSCQLQPDKSLHERGLKPFPNPTNGFVTLQILWEDAPKKEGSTIEIYNANGNKLIEQGVLSTDNIKQFDLSPYQDGTYFVLWRKGNTVYATSEIQLIRN